MIAPEQITKLANEFKIADSIVAREYFQILFLNELYAKPFANKICFKGGTCIRLVYGGKRFSEDLDFTVNYSEAEFEKDIVIFFKALANIYPITFKKRESLAGQTYLLTATLPNFKTELFIKLDFSFRENVIEPTQNILRTDYPIITSNFINCLSKDEIIAEKVRAIMSRTKLRDLYDLWIVQELGGKLRLELINEKLKFYQEEFTKDVFIERINGFQVKDFVTDLRPFVPSTERAKLEDLFVFVKAYCIKSVA